ncbi:hypothetical protein QTG54_016667 [Skeletonema marinoi]|uniref:Uncharacterized protein n=1 Tax=Skeletonema marinoi TaxID=267567 RepID=A0AAD8XRQ2_9STRA|nr:hypothetical protein QTG54_016667 [Skeletonema marinoi]
MDAASNSARSHSIMSRSSSFRRLLFAFYIILAIFTFAYWEEIQTFYNNSPSSPSSLVGASKQVTKSDSNNETAADNNAEQLPSSSSTSNGTNDNSGDNTIGEDTSPPLFCSTCNYLNDTSCNDRVDYLLRHLPESNPTKEVAQQNLMKVGHCIEVVLDHIMEKQEEATTTDGQCTFCEQGMIDPNFIVPRTSGHTCGQLRSMVLSVDENNRNGTHLCTSIQKEEGVCCPKNKDGIFIAPPPTTPPPPAVVKVNYKKDLNVTMPTQTHNMRNENGTFIGASEWYHYWTTAKNVKRSNNNNYNNTDSSQSYMDHSHDDYVLSRVKADFEKAIEHTRKMKSRYEEVNAIPDYRVRGLGWIDQRLGMVLTVAVVGDNDAAADREESMGVLSAGNISIFIVDAVGDMKCGGNDNNSDETLSDNWMDYHPPLTMWVRANGPEIFAGTALPHVFASSSSPGDRHRCAWRYEFEPRMPGVYSIYVKALTFNGFADWNKDLCKVKKLQWENNSTEDVGNRQIQAAIVHQLAEKGNFSHHRGLMAFKNYDQLNSCCEACTRSRGCRMWSIPGEIDECELYFDRIEDDIVFWDSDEGKHLGRDRTYSYAQQKVSDFPVARRRLRRRNDRRKLAMNRNEINLPTWPKLGVPDSFGYPREEPVLDFIGCGWSNLKSFESPCHYPSDDLIFGSGKRIEITVDSKDQIADVSIASKVEEKKACSVEDESFGNGRWVKYPFPDDSVCMPVERDLDNGGFSTYMPKYNGTSMPPFCWHRDNIDRCCNVCGEMGCRFIVTHRWVSDLRQSGKWFGRWENYDCFYDDLSSAEIQHCIDRKNISNIEVKGASVKQMLSRYIEQKLNGIQMVKPTAFSRNIVLDTLKMPHVVWHDAVKVFGNKLDAYGEINNETSEYYFVTGFYFSSEREPHVVVDRSLQFSNLAWKKLTPRATK